ncbi:cysteine--tRNA ligase [Tianweitania sp. BSSL-BM11]|uniref:Cysteine--tRNA ligase n=1 Tax=Tianweitania aestuarii TaxID=2814886 RepID=A0ABS5RSE0_9HYPH|nr:cysteine--tRNA ligase [Tianweitania aestuarii]MBS9719958.1 cysteine--tRNA ligase [Tianweitania aestuarii]
MADTQLRLTNTLTRSKDVFTPIDANNVRMYVCGPTVYDFAHIGNARPVIVFDVLYRLLRHIYGAEHVTYVRNITDVDDKINARALRDYPDLPLNEAIRKVTEKTADQFGQDVAALGCLEPSHQPRATEFVLPREDGKTDMVTLIQSLIDRGHAYAINGEILFDTASMQDYGKLSRRPLDEQQAGARIAVDAHKKNPGDFVLWKASSAEEPGWDAHFTVDQTPLVIRGRPGWHIECSAMSSAYLGEVFDIHGGGLDLIFPHHENEIAQSCCAHGRDVMANVWMHNGFVQVEGRKMSKSEGNFVTIHDLLHTEKFGGRKWPGEVLRLAMLKTNYREPIDFTVAKLEEALREIERWERLAKDAEPADAPDSVVLEALADDLNLNEAFVRVHALINDGQAAAALASLHLLGIDPVRKDEGDSGDIAEFVQRRLALIAAKNWAEADTIRDELLAKGIQLKDGKDPETGERITTWEVKR